MVHLLGRKPGFDRTAPNVERGSGLMTQHAPFITCDDGVNMQNLLDIQAARQLPLVTSERAPYVVVIVRHGREHRSSVVEEAGLNEHCECALCPV